MSTVLTIVLWMLMGVATAYWAYQRGRDPYIWFAIGIFFGVLGMLVLILLPPIKNEEETAVGLENDARIQRKEQHIQDHLEVAQDLQPQSVEVKEWFYLDKRRDQKGPFSFYVINELWEGKDLTPASLVWAEGMPEWKKIQDIPDLYQVLQNLESQNRKSFPEDF